MMAAVARVRLDKLLVDRGLAPSRERARALIMEGKVLVSDRPAEKPGSIVAADVEVRLRGEDIPYVSRGGLKLAHALDQFGLDVQGAVALDAGASTGGFTDVLLQRGASHVVALDVGRGQLDWRIRHDPRVTVMERVNARNLTPGQLPDTHRLFSIVTIDVSFISLRHILPVLSPLLAPGAHVIALVKPQFEAGRAEVAKGGIVHDDEVRMRVVEEVVAAADGLGLERQGLTDSPIAGMEGNREFLLHLRPRADIR